MSSFGGNFWIWHSIVGLVTRTLDCEIADYDSRLWPELHIRIMVLSHVSRSWCRVVFAILFKVMFQGKDS